MKNLILLFFFLLTIHSAHAQWQRVTNGVIPSNALRAGNEPDGTPIYIARVNHEGGVQIGKARQNEAFAFIPYGGKELYLGNYEVYIGTGTWSKGALGNFPSQAVRGGQEANGAPLYMVRKNIEGGIHPGKANANGEAFIPYGGKELYFTNDYEVLVSTQTNSTNTTIRLTDIDEWLCPKDLLRGDREFDGHGPRIKCEVKLSIGDGGKALYADIYLWAQETVHDWSTTERRWRKKVYDAPYGKTITAINSDRASRTQFISPPGGFQFLVPGNDVAATVNGFLDGVGGTITNAVLASFGIPPGDFRRVASLITGYINNGNTVVRVPALEGTLVRFFNIVGDTGGADISDDDNCNDDTRIVKLEFNPVVVTMR